MNKQKPLPETTEEGGLTDLILVQRIKDLRQTKDQTAGKIKHAVEELVRRLVEKGVTQATIGEDLILISPKLLTEYDSKGLESMRAAGVTDDLLWLVSKQIPSGKQLKELSDRGGAAVKSVIASAKRKIDSGTTTLKIKKPKQPRKPPRKNPLN